MVSLCSACTSLSARGDGSVVTSFSHSNGSLSLLFMSICNLCLSLWNTSYNKVIIHDLVVHRLTLLFLLFFCLSGLSGLEINIIAIIIIGTAIRPSTTKLTAIIITGSRSRVPSPVMLVADDGVMVIVMELVSILVALVLSVVVVSVGDTVVAVDRNVNCKI